MRDKYVKQGRVRADSSGQAALTVRDRWGDGRLVIGEPQPGWYEYYIEVIDDANETSDAVQSAEMS